jgi:hypothetical protein
MKAVSVITSRTNADETATANMSQLEDKANKLQEEISQSTFKKTLHQAHLKGTTLTGYLRIFYQYQIKLLPCAVNQALFFNEINVMYCSSM